MGFLLAMRQGALLCFALLWVFGKAIGANTFWGLPDLRGGGALADVAQFEGQGAAGGVGADRSAAAAGGEAAA
ncbi:MAG: hypothetical protein AUK47_03730 [Deltaproteobacteria bacterium CG2_30_63_29]|nr:MAG: hypothetical protein AUK47_03730 [Deltaproteobacteria bacterium CG2_30_63_29]PJB43750.1 MAG: hypothetical protein CO108_09685 [Deltaproteobacteria bacterium CG_4_9_14_3_um_filter_63_12]